MPRKLPVYRQEKQAHTKAKTHKISGLIKSHHGKVFLKEQKSIKGREKKDYNPFMLWCPPCLCILLGLRKH